MFLSNSPKTCPIDLTSLLNRDRRMRLWTLTPMITGSYLTRISQLNTKLKTKTPNKQHLRLTKTNWFKMKSRKGMNLLHQRSEKIYLFLFISSITFRLQIKATKEVEAWMTHEVAVLVEVEELEEAQVWMTRSNLHQTLVKEVWTSPRIA